MSTTAPIQPSVLDAFSAAGVLSVADVNVAEALGRLAGGAPAEVLLAAALAVRGPRMGHVCVDIRNVRHTVTREGLDDVEAAALPWPAPDEWLTSLGASPLVAVGGMADRPLVLEGERLYLERYWKYEHDVAEALRRRAVADAGAPEPAPTAADDVGDVDQAHAIRTAVSGPLTVIAGGPGTGKTTTVARLLDVLAAGRPELRVALVAPTGKAAARLAEAIEARNRTVHAEARIEATFSGTIHRLLQRRPGSHSRFRHDSSDPLPYDAVIVDETSMVSLPLMAKLLDAVRPEARLVLVGDPDQLASVEAGAVLGDVVRAAVPPSPLAGRVVTLRTSHRFGQGTPIGELAAAVRSGDPDRALDALRAASGPIDAAQGITWIEAPAEAETAAGELRDHILAPARACLEEAARAPAEVREGSPDPAVGALDALERLRVLCANRRGPYGVEGWNRQMERWLGDELGIRLTGWYHGRPVLVTANDYRTGLFNGDMGVVVPGPSGTEALFRSSGGVRRVATARLAQIETVHAMTIHKSQGSEFDRVVVALPPEASPLLTRELLYTAITRAREHVTIVATAGVIAAAVARPAARASGLGARLA